ncbi:aerotaxis receptor [Pseudomonas sp. CFII64]|nr:aerotaxis receptor [Pseudomonas sp. CFII64]
MSGYQEHELKDKSFELINHALMPKPVIQGMWRTLAKGLPWTAPLQGRHKDGREYWNLLYVMPLLDEQKRLSALGTLYFPLHGDALVRARQLYQRLNKGSSPWPLTVRVSEHLQAHGVSLAFAAAGFAAASLSWLSLGTATLLAGVALASSAQPHWRQQRLNRKLLALQNTAFADPLLTPLFSGKPGSAALLAMAFDSQRVRMNAVMTRLCINSEILRQQSEAATDVVHDNVTQLNGQAAKTEQSAAAINQMSATLQDLSRDLQQTAEAATRTDSLAREGQRLSEQCQVSMDSTGLEVRSIGEAVNRLASAIESISGIAQVIQSIAEQTNLLALNAAIEAARAGESGRGFAVVADEVRSLASRTAGSTRQIQQSINGLRADSQQAIDTVERGQQAAKRSQTDVAQAGMALLRICDEVGQISAMSQQMATAIEEQGQVTEQVNQQIVEIAGLTATSRSHAGQSEEISNTLSGLARSQLSLAQRFIAD